MATSTAARITVRALRDPLLWATIVVALFFVMSLVWYQQPAINWWWPLQQSWRFFLLIALFPIMEELLFRGWLQGWLLQQSWGVRRCCYLSYANLLCSVLFASLHLIYHPPLWAAAVIIPSLVLGFFRERYKALLPVMLLHSLFNLFYYWPFTG